MSILSVFSVLFCSEQLIVTIINKTVIESKTRFMFRTIELFNCDAKVQIILQYYRFGLLVNSLSGIASK